MTVIERGLRMYRPTVRAESEMPSFNKSSAAMRSSPQVRFALAMSLEAQARNSRLGAPARLSREP